MIINAQSPENAPLPTMPKVSLNLWDRLIGVISPKMGFERLKYKATNTFFNTFSNGFRVPGKFKKSMRGWFVSHGSADVDSIFDIGSARAGSRDLYMNTPVASGALRRYKTNVVGGGLQLQSRIDNEALNLTEEKAFEWERKAEREWNLWSNSKNCDVTRMNNFDQLQGLAFLSYLMSGDVFSLLPMRKVSDTWPYKLQVQLIEADQISNPNDFENIHTDTVRGGIELNKSGAVIAYWVRTKHPGDFTLERKWQRVPRVGERSGRIQVLHLFDKERPGQRRGIPILAYVMEQLKQLTRLSDSELMAAVVSSFFTVFIKNVPDGKPLAPGYVPEESVLKESERDQDKNLYEMGNGSIINLAENEEVQLADPKRPNDLFDPFFQSILKQIGASLEIPFELLIMHFSSSYSASRGVILEASKTFRNKRKWFAAEFNQPIYVEFLTEAVINGRLSAPGFLTDPLLKAAWCGSRWGAPGMGQIDPKKETEAIIKRLDANLTTYEDELQNLSGMDWDTNITRRAREEKRLKDLGILSKEEKASQIVANNEDVADEPTLEELQDAQ